jgi:two-component system chemotaxis response regulator CheY
LNIVSKTKPLIGDVLIVDDEKDICEIMKQYCENLGCFRHIIFAHDGAMASNKMRNQKFALILIDLKMPKKSGLDLMREFDDKSINKKSSVMVVSGTLDKTMLEKSIALGIKNFLPKPFDEAAFQEKVLKLIASAGLTPVAPK